MKKVFLLVQVLFGLCALLTLGQCSNEDMDNAYSSRGGYTLKAAIEAPANTRTAVSDEGGVTWSTGDMLAVYFSQAGGSSTLYKDFTLASGEGTTEATFSSLTATGVESATLDYALYPAAIHKGDAPSGTKITVTLDANCVNAPMLAVSSSSVDELHFKHLAALMKLTISSIPTGDAKLTITADKKISGDFEVDYSQSEPVISTAATSVDAEKKREITLSTGEATRTFYIPLPVGDLGNVNVKVTNSEGSKSYLDKTISSLTMVRKQLLLMPAVGCSVEVSASKPSDVNTVLDDMPEGITDVEIKSPDFGTASNDATISVPADKDVNLNFSSVPSTSSTAGGTLVITEKDLAENTPSAENSSNKVTVSIPEVTGSAEAPSVEIILPKTTVTLAPAAGNVETTFNEVTVTTAKRTFVVEKGVTIKKLTVKGGNVKIYGKVENLFKESGYTDVITRNVADYDELASFLSAPVSPYLDLIYVDAGPETYRWIHSQADVDAVMTNPNEASYDTYAIGKLTDSNTKLTFNKTVELTKVVEVYSDAEIENLNVSVSAYAALYFYYKNGTLKVTNAKLTNAQNSGKVIWAAGLSPHIEVYSSELISTGKNDVRGIHVINDDGATTNQTQPYVLVDNTNIRAMAESIGGDTDYSDSQITTFKGKDYSRGINIGFEQDTSSGTVEIKNGSLIEGYYYAVNVFTGPSDASIEVNAENSTIDGRAAFNIWQPNTIITTTGCKLVGRNYFTGSTEWFGNVVVNQSATKTSFSATNTELRIYNSPHVLSNLQFAVDVRCDDVTVNLGSGCSIKELGTISYPARLNYLTNAYSYNTGKYTFTTNTFNVGSNLVIEGKEGATFLPTTDAEGNPTITAIGDREASPKLVGSWKNQDGDDIYEFSIENEASHKTYEGETPKQTNFAWVLNPNESGDYTLYQVTSTTTSYTLKYVDDNTFTLTAAEGEPIIYVRQTD